MGRGRGKGRGKRIFNRDFGARAGREDNWDSNKRAKTGWVTETENPAFEEYYKAQGICPDDEWPDFLAALRRQLPLTFRINGGGRFADALRANLESNFFAEFASGPLVLDDEVVNPPQQLPWYPNKLGWQMDFSRTQLRKIEKLKALHEFMKRETEIGAITRQEAVSMVPPLFLDVQPHHRVLDMCAAPGSKTAQLLEALHAREGEPTGVVVANDADTQRCNMLTHQTQRIRSPALLVTNHEAQNFPIMWDLDPNSPDERVMYDRILCDVPCSGDGTLRKQPDIWRRWSSNQGNGLHLLQIKITLRACELLRVGGRIVYSTCTFNPIEDEAVVAEVLRRTNGSMRLVDVSAELPSLKRNPGLLTWKVKDRDNFYSTWEEGQNGYKLDPSMFPYEDTKELGLEKCMRFLPHHQDTGGFFVCVLEKVAPIVDLQYPTIDQRSVHKKGFGRKEKKEGEGDAGAADAPKEGEAAPEKAEDEAEAEPIETAEAKAAAPAAAPAAEEAAVAATSGNEEGAIKKKKEKPPKVLPEWDVRGGGARNRPGADTGAEGAAAAAEGGAPAAGQREQQQQQRHGGRWRGIDPIVPFIDPKEVSALRSAYGFAESCSIPDQFIVRSSEGRPKKLTYINIGAKMLLLMDAKEQLKVTACGLKMFERQENRDNLLETPYRLAQEGVSLVLPHMTKQKFQPTLEEFIHVLDDRAINLPESCKVHITNGKEGQAAEAAAHAEGEAAAPPAAEPAAPAAAAEAAEAKKNRYTFNDPSTLEQLKLVQYGCCVATLRAEDIASLKLAGEGSNEGGLVANAPIAIVCWRGRGSLNVLVSKQECQQMADRLKEAIAEKNATAGSASA